MSTSIAYAGFWRRLAASLIDTIWLLLLVYTLSLLLLGPTAITPEAPYTPLRLVLEWVLPILLVIGFWVFKSATPGKMLLGMKVVDAETLGPVPTGRLMLRYLGYYIASLPLMLGLLWVGWDPRKQGWHDKIAGTVVIRTGQAEQASAQNNPTGNDATWPT